MKAQRQPREVQGQPRGVWRQCWEPGAVPSHSVPPPRNFRGFSLTACLALLLCRGVCSCRTFHSLKCLGDRESDWSLPHQYCKTPGQVTNQSSACVRAGGLPVCSMESG